MSTTVAHRQQAEVTLDTQTIEVIAEIEAQVVAPVQAAPVHITWAQADTGLWVANYGGYYGGTVDRQGTHFFVADTFGRIVADELDVLLRLMHQKDAATARLGVLIDAVLGDEPNDVTFVWVQGWALGARSEPLAARVRAEMDAWQAALAAEIARGHERGEFGEGDADAIAWHLLAIFDGLGAHGLVSWRDDPSRADLTRRALAGLLGVPADALRP